MAWQATCTSATVSPVYRLLDGKTPELKVMQDNRAKKRPCPTALAATLLLACCMAGCQAFTTRARQEEIPIPPPIHHDHAPIEKDKVALPTYRISAPDILLIDALKIVPKPPFKIASLDQLQINASGTLAQQPILGIYAVEPSGSIDLGPAYGRVSVAGLTLDEATEAVASQLSRVLRQPQVSLTLAQSGGQQQIAGEHLVASDGRINLGTYGNVYVAGMTVEEARDAIQAFLSKTLDNPRVAVDVGSYNSMVYYIITDGAGVGQSVSRFPVTGNETVLDALSNVNGLSQLASKHHVWIARPAPQELGCDQRLRVNWDDITKHANTSTNYQVLPGDRIFIGSDRFYALDNTISKITAPFERIFGLATLGVQVIFRTQHPSQGFSGGNGGSAF